MCRAPSIPLSFFGKKETSWIGRRRLSRLCQQNEEQHIISHAVVNILEKYLKIFVANLMSVAFQWLQATDMGGRWPHKVGAVFPLAFMVLILKDPNPYLHNLTLLGSSPLTSVLCILLSTSIHCATHTPTTFFFLLLPSQDFLSFCPHVSDRLSPSPHCWLSSSFLGKGFD